MTTFSHPLGDQPDNQLHPTTPAGVTLRRATARGHANHGWLDTWHTFSFANYHDPAHMGFRGLRVINDDRIAANMGFGTHGHQDMEIITYVLDGELSHRDSLGNGDVLHYHDVQRMSAGSGIRHSEFNASTTTPAHLLQIWIEPTKSGTVPSYEQKRFAPEERQNRFRYLVDQERRDGALPVGADASLAGVLLSTGATAAYELGQDRHAWLHVATGAVTVAGLALQAGDALAFSQPGQIKVTATADSDVLLFDLG